MTSRIAYLLGVLAIALAVGTSAQASTILNFGGDGSTLHGASGSLTIIDNGTDYTVVWSIDFTNFTDAAAINTGHEYLTDIGFKAFTSISSVEQLGDSVGQLYYPSNINTATDGCDTNGSSAGFVCVVLNPLVLATVDTTFSVSFKVEGQLMDDTSEWSYRGKYGEGRGWVISENGASAVPEPSAALVFAIGTLAVGLRLRR